MARCWRLQNNACVTDSTVSRRQGNLRSTTGSHTPHHVPGGPGSAAASAPPQRVMPHQSRRRELWQGATKTPEGCRLAQTSSLSARKPNCNSSACGEALPAALNGHSCRHLFPAVPFVYVPRVLVSLTSCFATKLTARCNRDPFAAFLLPTLDTALDTPRNATDRELRPCLHPRPRWPTGRASALALAASRPPRRPSPTSPLPRTFPPSRTRSSFLSRTC